MNRRQFIQITGLSTAYIGLAATLKGCASAPSIDLIGRDSQQFNQNDIRLKVIAYGMLSPTPHNKQPWRITMTGPNSFLLSVDMFRLLPATDPYHRQIHLGQGTFIESLHIAAQQFGYATDIDYFPEGMYNNEVIEDKPVAHITLRESGTLATDPLFNYLTQRQSIKTPYDNYKLSTGDIENIRSDYHLGSHWSGEKNKGDFPLVLSSNEQTVSQIQNTLIEAMEIEDRGADRVHETITMFRFNDEELHQYRDGFGLANSGITGIKKMVIEQLLLDREKVEKDPTDFGKKAIELTREQALSCSSFGWMNSETNTRLDQVKVGRAYCRLHLILTKYGLAMHPMSQVLQEYSDMLPLQKRFLSQLKVPEGNTMQMIFRIGHAASTIKTPRRSVRSLLV